MLRIFLFSFLLLPVLAFSQETIDKTGSSVSPAGAQEMLDHHNKIRNDLQLPPLKWSTELASHAQAWADTLASSGDCKLRHRQANAYGENIYMSSFSDSFKIVSASAAWYTEKESYTYSKIGDEGSDRSMHYTQMIWKKTNELGAGMAVCPNGNIIVVANYNPSGNFTGEYPY